MSCSTVFVEAVLLRCVLRQLTFQPTATYGAALLPAAEDVDAAPVNRESWLKIGKVSKPNDDNAYHKNDTFSPPSGTGAKRRPILSTLSVRAPIKVYIKPNTTLLRVSALLSRH